MLSSLLRCFSLSAATAKQPALTPVAATAMAAYLIIAPAAQASVISCGFSSNASVVLDDTTNTITGSFDFNTSTDTATDVSIIISGADEIDNIPGTYTAASETIGSNGELFAYSAAQYEFGGPLETVEFGLDPSPSISGGSPLAIEDVLWDYAAAGYYDQTGMDITGDVMNDAPELSDIAILVVGFSGILFSRRVGRRKAVDSFLTTQDCLVGSDACGACDPVAKS
jgi:hypothetical protein